MPTETDNYGFTKDNEDEFYNVNTVNANLDKIDTEMKRIEDSMPTITPTDSVKWLGTVTGTANALTVTHAAITSYSDGLGVSFAANANSTAATTLNINGLGAIPIKKANGTAFSNAKANGVYTVRYRNASFILQGEGGAEGNVTPDKVLSPTTYTDPTTGDLTTGTMPNRGAPTITPTTSDQTIPQGYYSGGTIKGYPNVLYKTNVEIPSGSTVYIAPSWGLATTMFAMLEKVGEINDSASVNFTSQKETGSGTFFPQKGNNLEVGYSSFNSSLSLKSSYGGTHVVVMAKRI